MSNKPAGQVSRTASQSLLEKFEDMKSTDAFVAITGRGDTAKTVLVPNRPGFVFVRIPKLIEGGEITEFSEAQAFSVNEFRHGIPVLITQSKQNPSQYEIKETWNVGMGQAIIESINKSISAHHQSHEAYSPVQGHDPVLLDPVQLRNMQVTPTSPASSRVKVGAGWYMWKDGNIHFYDGEEVELSDRVPSGTLTLNYVSLSLNHDTQEIEFVETLAVNTPSAIPDVEDLLVWPSEERVPLAGVRLKGGEYQIGWARDGIPSIIDMRPFQSMMPAEIRALASGTLSIIEENYIGISANDSILNFLGNMFHVDQEGTSGRVTITGTLDLEEDDAFVVAADTVNFEGDGAFIDFSVIDEGARKGTVSGTFDETEIRHEALNFLQADDHLIYAKLDGRVGGQTLIGGTGSGDDLTLQSTSHATKGAIFLNDDADIAGHAAIGDDASISTTRILNLAGTFIDSASNVFGAFLQAKVNLTSDNAFNHVGLKGVATTSNHAFDLTSTSLGLRGVEADFNNQGSGVIASAAGLVAQAQQTGSGSVTIAEGIRIQAPANTGGGSFGTLIGLSIKNQAIGSTNFAIVTNAGNVVFNEGGDASTDFRVEGGTETYLLFTDAGNDRVGIGDSTPNARLDIVNDAAATIGLIVQGAASQSANLLELQESDASIFLASGDGLTGSEFIINEQGEDIDIRMESDTDANQFFLDAGNNVLQVGSFETQKDRIKSTETSTGTATMSDTVEVHICNSASPYTLTLPAHKTDKEIRIINIGAGTVTLSPTSGNIKGSATEVLTQWESLILISDNTDWI